MRLLWVRPPPQRQEGHTSPLSLRSRWTGIWNFQYKDVALPFGVQGTGYLIAGTVTIIIAAIWSPFETARDYAWRLALVGVNPWYCGRKSFNPLETQAIGCAPPMTSMVMRILQPETERYQIMVQVCVMRWWSLINIIKNWVCLPNLHQWNQKKNQKINNLFFP